MDQQLTGEPINTQPVFYEKRLSEFLVSNNLFYFDHENPLKSSSTPIYKIVPKSVDSWIHHTEYINRTFSKFSAIPKEVNNNDENSFLLSFDDENINLKFELNVDVKSLESIDQKILQRFPGDSVGYQIKKPNLPRFRVMDDFKSVIYLARSFEKWSNGQFVLYQNARSDIKWYDFANRTPNYLKNFIKIEDNFGENYLNKKRVKNSRVQSLADPFDRKYGQEYFLEGLRFKIVDFSIRNLPVGIVKESLERSSMYHLMNPYTVNNKLVVSKLLDMDKFIESSTFPRKFLSSKMVVEQVSSAKTTTGKTTTILYQTTTEIQNILDSTVSPADLPTETPLNKIIYKERLDMTKQVMETEQNLQRSEPKDQGFFNPFMIVCLIIVFGILILNIVLIMNLINFCC